MHLNRLAREASPYLLQHKNNPVDWYPWGDEALARAKREDKPILLSVGYAACHWCHVMERESFEDAEIAALMNDRFINIKVDREERPDLDQIYQLVVQVMGRGGGWPLTVFLTPELRPFFAGTYFPPADKLGMPGFPKVLLAMADAYESQRGDVEEQAREITGAINRAGGGASRGGAHVEVGSDLLRKASRKLIARFDDRNGGFGARPKFPNTMALDVLLCRGVVEGDRVCRESVARALDHMRAGGIWDHLRGGFHRYSTDERWLVPHFEKMLYDNALLLRMYADGYRVFGEPRYAETARSIVRYLFAEMRDDAHGGGFFASQDADSEGHEGKFFVFTLSDLRAATGADQALYDVARLHYGITEEGNFEGSGATVLSEVRAIDRVAASLDMALGDAERALDEARRRMLAHRETRPRPMRDDKVLASWNALTISALADAGRALAEPSWIEAAARAFATLEQKLVREGRVGRFSMNGEPASDRPGFLDDHSYMGNAALDLYEATGDPRYVSVARAIAGQMIAHHADKAQGGFFFAPDDGEALIVRLKDAYDQAVPSGASMAAILCLRLADLCAPELAKAGEDQLLATAEAAMENAFGLGRAVIGLARLVEGSTSIAIVGPRDAEATRALADAAHRAYVPSRTIAIIDPSDPASIEAAKVLAEGKLDALGSVAYVCKGRACSAPVSTPEALTALLAVNERSER